MADIEVVSEKVSMKVDSNRRIYVKYHDKDGQYHFIDAQVPLNLTSREKEDFLMNFRDLLIEDLEKKEPQLKEPGEEDLDSQNSEQSEGD